MRLVQQKLQNSSIISVYVEVRVSLQVQLQAEQ